MKAKRLKGLENRKPSQRRMHGRNLCFTNVHLFSLSSVPTEFAFVTFSKFIFLKLFLSSESQEVNLQLDLRRDGPLTSTIENEFHGHEIQPLHLSVIMSYFHSLSEVKPSAASRQRQYVTTLTNERVVVQLTRAVRLHLPSSILLFFILPRSVVQVCREWRVYHR